MSRMRDPWQGIVHFEGVNTGHFTGNAHLYTEDLQDTVAPFQFRDAEGRWWFVGDKDDAAAIGIGYTGWSRWPHNLEQDLKWMVHSLIRHRFAVIEWGIIDHSPQRSMVKLHMLPAWSCELHHGTVYQRQKEDEAPARIERGVAITLPSVLQRVLDEEIRAVLELENHYHAAMRKAGPAILGATGVDVMGVIGEVDIRAWTATKRSGYVPRASQLTISPAYRALRRVRFASMAQQIRLAILPQFNALLATAYREVGRSLTVGYEESWDPGERERLERLALGSDADREELERTLDAERVERRARLEAQIAEAGVETEG